MCAHDVEPTCRSGEDATEGGEWKRETQLGLVEGVGWTEVRHRSMGSACPVSPGRGLLGPSSSPLGTECCDGRASCLAADRDTGSLSVTGRAWAHGLTEQRELLGTSAHIRQAQLAACRPGHGLTAPPDPGQLGGHPQEPLAGTWGKLRLR